jgi:hypothetical protein
MHPIDRSRRGHNQETISKLDYTVTPAKAGVQSLAESSQAVWIPAFAGMTVHLLVTLLSGDILNI